ncbi:unnamed protein product [Caenorhabditis auriculariae]|uniref:Uncharacterized protein n=1 Tax=Caenorhabditis auriculariae TaxID=2777116 RepID=A0A8S1HQG2_9PELO|nr:unnamed protein product [Caenorhabditis auriculariae]
MKSPTRIDLSTLPNQFGKPECDFSGIEVYVVAKWGNPTSEEQRRPKSHRFRQGTDEKFLRRGFVKLLNIKIEWN